MKRRRVLRGLHQLGDALDARVMAAGDIPHVTVGRHTYGLRWSSVMGATASSPLTIGSFCSIAPEVTFLCHVGHPVDLPSTYPFRTLMFDRPAVSGGLNADAVTRGPIAVGHDVWLGFRVTVLSGVTIGTGAVIGAGAIVTRDIPPYALAVGCPANVVRHRFDDATIAALLASRWWELPDESLAALEPELYNRDIQQFLAAVERIRTRAVRGGT